MAHLLFQDILIIFLLSVPTVLLLKRFHLPVTIGFMLVGALIGPHGLKLIHESEQINMLAEVGLALLLFSVGMEFSLHHFAQIKKRALTASTLQIIITIAAGWLVGFLLGWSTPLGITFGSVLALSSTAVVLTVMHQQKMTESLSGQVSTVMLLVQDLAFIPIVIFLPLLGVMSVQSETTFGPMLLEKGKALLVLAAITIVGIKLIKPFLRIVSHWGQRDLFTIVIILIGLGMSWVANQLGVSFALGAFLGGMIVGLTEYKYQALAEIAPFRYAFNSLFFVSLGMLLNIHFVREHYLFIGILLAFIPVLKLLIITFVVTLCRFPLKIGLIAGISLGQIGEFSFLLVQSGYEAHVINPYLYNLIIATAVFSMMLTPVMVTYSHKIVSVLSLMIPQIKKTAIEEGLKKLSLSNHVIICGFGVLGETLGRILKDNNVPYLVLELNPKTIARIRTQEMQAYYGDGTSEEILFESGIETASLLAITVPHYIDNIAIIKKARQLNTKITIVTRAKYKSDSEKLYAAGADVVISEELEGGIEMGKYILKLTGVKPQQVEEYAKKIREFGSADFF